MGSYRTFASISGTRKLGGNVVWDKATEYHGVPGRSQQKPVVRNPSPFEITSSLSLIPGGRQASFPEGRLPRGEGASRMTSDFWEPGVELAPLLRQPDTVDRRDNAQKLVLDGTSAALACTALREE